MLKDVFSAMITAITLMTDPLVVVLSVGRSENGPYSVKEKV